MDWITPLVRAPQGPYRAPIKKESIAAGLGRSLFFFLFPFFCRAGRGTVRAVRAPIGSSQIDLSFGCDTYVGYGFDGMARTECRACLAVAALGRVGWPSLFTHFAGRCPQATLRQRLRSSGLWLDLGLICCCLVLPTVLCLGGLFLPRTVSLALHEVLDISG